jgi:hypothetical protein
MKSTQPSFQMEVGTDKGVAVAINGVGVAIGVALRSI